MQPDDSEWQGRVAVLAALQGFEIDDEFGQVFFPTDEFGSKTNWHCIACDKQLTVAVVGAGECYWWCRCGLSDGPVTYAQHQARREKRN